MKNVEYMYCAYVMAREESCMKNCCSRGASLSPISSLINHSCYNNVSKCFTDDGKIVIYALQPIKKNSEVSLEICFNFFNMNFYKYTNNLFASKIMNVCMHTYFMNIVFRTLLYSI